MRVTATPRLFPRISRSKFSSSAGFTPSANRTFFVSSFVKIPASLLSAFSFSSSTLGSPLSIRLSSRYASRYLLSRSRSALAFACRSDSLLSACTSRTLVNGLEVSSNPFSDRSSTGVVSWYMRRLASKPSSKSFSMVTTPFPWTTLPAKSPELRSVFRRVVASIGSGGQIGDFHWVYLRSAVLYWLSFARASFIPNRLSVFTSVSSPFFFPPCPGPSAAP
mmetsp:Transcript_15989/g.39549  ORF Transcript_15989/g.39549 Transcript_15989/m.39549 type:complete len:221 (-) Transcript_15989:799-1461(-)